MSENGRTVLDLTIYKPGDTDEWIKDRLGREWHVYGGMPVDTAVGILRQMQKARQGSMTLTELENALDTIWATLERNHPGETLESFRKGFDLDDLPLVVDFLYSRAHQRATGQAMEGTSEIVETPTSAPDDSSPPDSSLQATPTT